MGFCRFALRALADLICFRKEVSRSRDGLGFLTDSMRIEENDLRAMPFDDFDAVCSVIRNRRIRRFLEGLLKEIRQ